MAARSWNLYLLCSDAKKDAHLRDALAQHLEGPALRGAVVYHDGRMPIGARREEWRQQRLREADLILVILSTHISPVLDLFEREVRPLRRPIVPVLLRDMSLDGTYFEGRRIFGEGGGLARLSPVAREKAYSEISKEVLRLLDVDKQSQGGESSRAALPDHLPPPQGRYNPTWYISRGREDEAIDYLRTATPFMVLGPACCGKSTFLEHIQVRLRKEDFWQGGRMFCVSCDQFKADKLDSMLDELDRNSAARMTPSSKCWRRRAASI